MPQSLSQAVASFLSNLIELGVCDQPSCCNAYYSLPEDFPGTIAAMLEAAAPETPAALTRSAVPLPNALLREVQEAARGGGAAPFPTGSVGRQLTSSFAALSVSLQHFVDVVFTAVSNGLEVRLETLLYSLCLLERVQRANVLVHQHHGVLQRDLMSSVTDSAANTVSEPPSSAQSGRGSVSRPGSSALRPSTATTSIAHCASLACSSTVGPLTDAETAAPSPAGLCGPAPYLRLPPNELATSSGRSTPGAQDVTLCPLSHRTCCNVCAGSPVFGVQYFNVHLLLAACLLLSTQINEATALAGVPEDKAITCVAAACGCDEENLLIAQRVICESLHFDLSVTPAAVDSLLRRLGAVEVPT